MKRHEAIDVLAFAQLDRDEETVERMLRFILAGDKAREEALLKYAHMHFGKTARYQVMSEMQHIHRQNPALIGSIWHLVQNDQMASAVQLLIDLFTKRVARVKAQKLAEWAETAPLQPYEATTATDDSDLFDVVTDDERGEPAPVVDTRTPNLRYLNNIWR